MLHLLETETGYGAIPESYSPIGTRCLGANCKALGEQSCSFCKHLYRLGTQLVQADVSRAIQGLRGCEKEIMTETGMGC